MASDTTHRLALPLFALFIAVAAAIAYAPRVSHYRGWEENRANNFAGEVAASGTDSYYWFRVARELRDGTWDSESVDPLRDHPDGRHRGPAPWISRVIAGIADGFDVDVYRAGLWFTLVTSCLFVFPMCLFGWRVGWPAAGLLGALMAAASVAYFSRASIHRVDTDGANLFGLWWIAFVFALPRKGMSTRYLAGLAALAGVSVGLFVGWYDQAGFWLVLAGSFLICLIAHGFTARRVLVLFAVFVVCANPLYLLASIAAISDYISDYLLPTLAVGTADAPAPSPLEYSSISSRIEEMTPFPIGRSLSRIFEPAWLAAISLLIFVAWAIREWRRAAPLAPLVALGLLGMLSAKRFLMFLAPSVGFGLGVALTYGVRRVMGRTRFAPRSDMVACLFAFAVFGLLASGTSYESRPKASNSAKLLASLQRAASRLPAGSVVWHSWGAGYLLQDVMGAATFNDGERPNPVIDHLLVKGLTSDDPRELQRIVAHLMSHPRTEVTEAFRGDYDAAYAEMLAGDGVISGDVFLLFNLRSPVEFPGYYYRGQWDFRVGAGRPETFHRLRCRKQKARLFRCRDSNKQAVELDLSKGMIARTTPFEKALIIRDGAVVQEFDYPNRSGQVLQLFSTSGSASVVAYLVSPAVYASNLNQLYMLDRADQRYFEKVYDDTLVARLFRVKGSMPDEPKGIDVPIRPAPSAASY